MNVRALHMDMWSHKNPSPYLFRFMDQWGSHGGCGWRIPSMITSITRSTSSCKRNRWVLWRAPCTLASCTFICVCVCVLQVVTGEPQHIVFTIPIFEPLPSQYYIKAVSDRWLGAEAVCIMNFQNLILPERHPPHTGTYAHTHLSHGNRHLMTVLQILQVLWTVLQVL